ncbi:hypothetical protein [Aquicoccus sp.]|uniref:hypothetical protein n=1 Tax=Aquicoccus sp. TaxID=2055851 RepID=UPI003568D995
MPLASISVIGPLLPITPCGHASLQYLRTATLYNYFTDFGLSQIAAGADSFTIHGEPLRDRDRLVSTVNLRSAV